MDDAQPGRPSEIVPSRPRWNASGLAARGPGAPRFRCWPRPAPARPATPEGGETGGLLVDYAGIVLLHPFLPRFFERLGIAAGGELVDPSRALCLLHHLATGELTAPEHRLTLAKVLCGATARQPVEADVGLTDAETAEATALARSGDPALGGAARHHPRRAARPSSCMRPGMLSRRPPTATGCCGSRRGPSTSCSTSCRGASRSV